MTSLIHPENTLALLCAALSAVAIAFTAERSRWGARISGVVLTISLGLVFANVGLVPHTAPLYDQIGGLLVPLAIPLLLFKADLRRLRREGGVTLVLFLIGAAGTLLGALLAASLLDLGPKEPILAGMLTGTYIGGSMNLVALAQAGGLKDPALFAATVAADNIAGTLYLLLLGTYAALGAKSAPVEVTNADPAPEPFSIVDLATALALSAIICITADLVTYLAGREELRILLITSFAALAANLLPNFVGGLRGSFDAGMLLFALFFFTIGAGADVGRLVGAAGFILLFAAITIAVHAAVVLIATKVLRARPHEAAIASNACVLGPATAAAMAANLGRRDLVAPGLLCGVLGYVVATFVGMGVIRILG